MTPTLKSAVDLGGFSVIVENVTRIFPPPNGSGKSVHALGPVDLKLARGEFFSVIGPSGCGKSTLLDIVAGLNAPTEGVVLFDGKQVAGEVPAGIGIVFQEDACFPWLSVRDNIAFGLRRSGHDKTTVDERVSEALALTGLSDFAHAFPAQLSGGMRQRVCIARTLVLRPSLILLDEPFGALDQQTRLLMGDELLKLWRASNATVMLITHSLDEAAMLSDRVGVMSARPGRILDIVETGWARDRDNSVAETEKFGQLTTRLWSLLREQSRVAMSQSAQR